MDIVKLIKTKCLELDMTTRDLERELGFSNGYIQTLKKPMRNYKRAKAIAERLNIPLSELINYGSEESAAAPQETPKTPDFEPVMKYIEETHGAGTAEAIQMLLELDSESRAEIRGEMRAMLRGNKGQA